MRRCLRLLKRPDMSVWLAKELQQSSSGCMGWSPSEFPGRLISWSSKKGFCSADVVSLPLPGWLLLEVDNDFCIREQQAMVAKEMIYADENQLLQLNMGEGKQPGHLKQGVWPF